MNEKILNIVQLLIDRTKSKTAVWQKAKSSDGFRISINGKSYLTIEMTYDNFNNLIYILCIYNDDGHKIVQEDYDITTEIGTKFAELHDAAHNCYYKVDDTINELFDNLKNTEGTVGEINTLPPSFDDEKDDDLPF